MRRQPLKQSEVEWTKVSPKHPCIVCAGHAGCLRGVDDEFACCSHVPSEWPLSAGGWVHRVEREAATEEVIGVARHREAAAALNGLNVAS
jgi:hypothetical protein